jgi:putative colanic acid biosynthesis UDP-glucose lipid carrier transferase
MGLQSSLLVPDNSAEEVPEYPSLIDSSREPNQGTTYLLSTTKRSIDVFLVLIALLILLPLFVFVGLAIRVTSRGPVFFRQTRRGFGAKHFTMYKFRSMYVPDRSFGEFIQATRDDPRVTPIGRFLRAASIDELPQLINVLRGEMSLVGPRPHPLALDDKYAPHLPNFSARFSARPGLSGVAQINGARGETPTIYHMKRRLDFDIQYVRDASLLLDIKILAQTTLILFFSRDAY